jgi:hypothetical protein
MEHDRMSGGVDGNGMAVCPELDVVLLVPADRPNIPALQVLLGAQVRLR